MLNKDLYDSWKSRMELYMQNRESGRMILESVEHGPLIWPTIEENGVIRTKKYDEPSTTEKIQAYYDMKAINIILQGLPTDIYSPINHHRVAKDLWEKSSTTNASLPPEWSKFVTDVKLVKDLHTTNFDQLHAYLEQHELYANEVRLMREGSQDPLALVANHQMTPVTSNDYQVRNSSNPRQQATIHDGRVTVQPLQGRQNSYAAGTSGTRANTSGTRGNYSAQGNGKFWNEERIGNSCRLGIAEGPVTQSVITHNATYQADDLDVYDSDCDEISTAKAVLMANLSSFGSDVLSEENEITSNSNIIPYSQYLLETQNAAVQDTNSSAKNNAMILSVFEQLSNQVTSCNKVNKDNLIANESLFAKLERYKERVKLLEERQNVDLSTREKLIIDDIIREKNAQFADFEKEFNNLKQTLSE
ncbi:hypothetical protein Tco_0123356 [Tanacetum coccineum]